MLQAKDHEAADLIRLAPVNKWRFHERDPERLIEREAYEERVRTMQLRLQVN